MNVATLKLYLPVLAILFWLPESSILVHAQSDLEVNCNDATNEVAMCAWTADCGVSGCANKCILNRVVMFNRVQLNDRGYSDDFYMTCPVLSYWVAFFSDTFPTSSASAPSRRRLSSSSPEVMRFVKHAHASTAAREREQVSQHVSFDKNAGSASINSGRKLSESADEPFSFDYDGSAFAPDEEDLFAYEATADSPSSDDPYLVNACPSLETLSDTSVQLNMISEAARIVTVLQKGASGQPLVGDEFDIEFVLESPNMWRLLARYFGDPDLLKEYMTTRCSTQTFDSTSFLYDFSYPSSSNFLVGEPEAPWTVQQCASNFGAHEEFFENYKSVLAECDPPFGVEPVCYGYWDFWYIVTSPTCALAFAAAYNISDVTPLMTIADVNAQVHAQCQTITDQASCESATSQEALNAVYSAYDQIPYKNEIPGGAAATAPTAAFDDATFPSVDLTFGSSSAPSPVVGPLSIPPPGSEEAFNTTKGVDVDGTAGSAGPGAAPTEAQDEPATRGGAGADGEAGAGGETDDGASDVDDSGEAGEGTPSGTVVQGLSSAKELPLRWLAVAGALAVAAAL